MEWIGNICRSQSCSEGSIKQHRNEIVWENTQPGYMGMRANGVLPSKACLVDGHWVPSPSLPAHFAHCLHLYSCPALTAFPLSTGLFQSSFKHALITLSSNPPTKRSVPHIPLELPPRCLVPPLGKPFERAVWALYLHFLSSISWIPSSQPSLPTLPPEPLFSRSQWLPKSRDHSAVFPLLSC